MADESMTGSSKWERCDVACSRLSLTIGHYSELIHREEISSKPDTLKLMHGWGCRMSFPTAQRCFLWVTLTQSNK